MARTKFNLDAQELNEFSILIHGINASGKTHLLGDFLREEGQYGSVQFINVAGEDGALTIKGMGLGDHAETIDSYKDFEAAIDEYRQAKTHAIGVDSLTPLNKWLRVHLFKSDRFPNGAEEWSELHRLMDNLMYKLKRSAKLIMCTCPSDRSGDQVTQKTYITPDLPGKEARSSAGWFDFVGYISAEPLNATTVKRTLLMTPNGDTTVRQRLPKQITDRIVLPTGPGGWHTIKQAIEAGWKDAGVETRQKGV